MVLGLFGNKAAQEKPEKVEAEPVILNIEKLVLDAGTQSRAKLDEAHIERLKDAREAGATLPPIRVMFDGTNYYLFDGFHRVEAHKRIGLLGIAAYVEQGSLRDAILKSVGANSDHGLPRTRDDKWRAVERLLRDPEWGTWSNHVLAAIAKVSPPYVGTVRKTVNGTENNSSGEVKHKNKHGQITTMKTANIGKKASKPEPTAPLGQAVWGPPAVKAPELPPAPDVQVPEGIDEGELEAVGADLADEALEFGHALPEPQQEVNEPQADLDIVQLSTTSSLSTLLFAFGEMLTEVAQETAEELREALNFTGAELLPAIAKRWAQAVHAVKDGEGDICPGCHETVLKKQDEGDWWCDQCREYWTDKQLAEHHK